MKKLILIFLLYIVSTFSFAEKAIDCHKINEMSADMIKVCVDHTHRQLQINYQALVKRYTGNDQEILLRNMQLGWFKMRDAQCELASRNTGGNKTITAVVCKTIVYLLPPL